MAAIAEAQIKVAADDSLAVNRRPFLGVLRSATRLPRTRIGLVGVALVLAVGLLGPLVAPHDSTEFVGRPYQHPSAEAWLGTDTIGRDVFSRLLHGGKAIIWLSAASSALSVVFALFIALYAAYVRGRVDDALMRLMDVLLAFPAIVLALLAISAIGPKLWVIVVVTALGTMPLDARVLRSAAQQVVERDFVRAAEAGGEARFRILTSEVLPNITGTLMVVIGQRMTYTILSIASLSFLGFGIQPPGADWGLMINENRLGLVLQPWSVLAPAIAIGLFTVAFNLVTDGLARAAAGIERG